MNKDYISFFFGKKILITYNVLGDILVTSINVFELKRLSNINLIDIRSIEKYNDNHIRNAINIPKIMLVKYYFKYLDKNKIYYIYCETGEQSIKICSLLNSLGYHTINILGGYENWILNS